MRTTLPTISWPGIMGYIRRSRNSRKWQPSKSTHEYRLAPSTSNCMDLCAPSKRAKTSKQQRTYIGSADAAILNFNIDVVVFRLLRLEVDYLKLVPIFDVVDAGGVGACIFDGDSETYAYPFHTRSSGDMMEKGCKTWYVSLKYRRGFKSNGEMRYDVKWQTFNQKKTRFFKTSEY